MRYQKLGNVKKKKGLQLWEFHFNYSLLSNDITKVFVMKKAKKKVLGKKEVQNENRS